MQWWFDGMQTPPLVQRFTAMPNPADNVNIGTSFGGNELLDDGRSGYRILVGLWLDDYGKWGLEGDYYSFESLRTAFTDGGDGSADPAVGRPYINTDLGRFVENVSTPGLQGTVAVAVDSDFMTSGIRLRHNLCCTQAAAVGCGDCVDCGMGIGCGQGVGCGSGVGPAICPLLNRGLRRTDVVFGLRHAQLEENIRIREDLEVIDLTEEQEDAGFTPPQSGGIDIPIGTTFDVMDDFGTSNEFVGVDFGYIWEWEYRRWSLELASRIALGNTRQRVAINGATTRVLPGPPVTSETQAGGLLTQASNIGRYERDQFSVLPELGATVGFEVTQNFRLTFGYTLLYWSNVVRPGDQIDLVVNPDNIPFQTAGGMTEPLLPAFAFDDVSIWAQGISVGADYSW